jgi:Lar family restriction alleviation protein
MIQEVPPSTELKSCPFCGAPAVLYKDSLWRIFLKTWEVMCLRCGASAGIFDKYHQAETVWNLRSNEGAE